MKLKTFIPLILIVCVLFYFVLGFVNKELNVIDRVGYTLELASMIAGIWVFIFFSESVSKL